MDNELKIFKYNEQSVRTVQIDGETMFVLKDVCSILGIADHKVAARRLDEDEVCQIPLADSLGRMQETSVVNESGLYNVILRSDKPEAKPFRKWVTSEVLPSIRKTGSYRAQPMSTAQMFAMQAQVNLEQEQRLKALEKRAENVQAAFETLALPTVSRDHWQEETRSKIRQLCVEYEKNFQTFTGQLYRELEEAAGANLETRQKRLRERMKTGGAKYAECQAVSKLTVIAQDRKLREIFSGIVRRHSAELIAAKTPIM